MVGCVMAKGEELLVADSADRDREGLRKLFEEAGYVCTGCKDIGTARDLIRRKFFPAAVVDLDFGSTNGGLDFIRELREHSKPTSVVLLAGRRSFEAAVDAMRLGVVDVVSKRPDQIGHLKASVDQAVDRYHATQGSGLVAEMRQAMEDSLKIMFSMARQVYGRADGGQSGLQMKPLILIIDEDQRFLGELANLVTGRNWEVSIELSGGSGLDKASSFQFQILAVREELADLPGPMVVKSAQGQGSELLAIVYSANGGGHIDRYERGQPVGRHPFSGAESLVQHIDGLVDELGALREEKRTLQSFRNEHGAFLRCIAELKARIDAL